MIRNLWNGGRKYLLNLFTWVVIYWNIPWLICNCYDQRWVLNSCASLSELINTWVSLLENFVRVPDRRWGCDEVRWPSGLHRLITARGVVISQWPIASTSHAVPVRWCWSILKASPLRLLVHREYLQPGASETIGACPGWSRWATL